MTWLRLAGAGSLVILMLNSFALAWCAAITAAWVAGWIVGGPELRKDRAFQPRPPWM